MKKMLTFLIAIFFIFPCFSYASEMPAGNIMQAGETILAEGEANGLIMLIGQTVSSNASGEYAFIAGQDINLNGNVLKDAFIAGQNITISQTGNIARDVYALGQKVTIHGNVNGKIYVLASELVITENAVINGDIMANVGIIHISNTAEVNGTVEYNADANAIIPDTIRTNVIPVEESVRYVPSVWDKLKDKLLGIAMNLILFLVMVLIMPALFHKMDQKYNSEELGIGKTIGIGAAALFLVPVISLFLIVFVMGISAGFALLLAYALLIMLSSVTASYAISKMLWKEKFNTYLGAILLIIAIQLVELIPFLGGIVKFVVILLGMGIMIESLRETKGKE